MKEDSLRAAWERHAEEWIAWARTGIDDPSWQLNLETLSTLLPEPGRLTLDVGCGEGRLLRALAARGHASWASTPPRHWRAPFASTRGRSR